MLIAAGNINQDYVVIGVVHATVSRTPKGGGCGSVGGLPIQEAYQAVTKSLADAATASGGDGLIHVHYDYRMASQSVGCGNSTQAVLEVYGWGTAIKLKS